MTPRRRDRFFLSLHQLEQRLASESSHSKKTRLAGDNGLTNAEPAAHANPISICGSPDPLTTSDDGASHAHDCRFSGFNATSPCCLADVTATTCGLTSANARLTCGLTNVSLPSPYRLIENVLPASAHLGSACVEPADIDPTSMNAGHVGAGVDQVGLRLIDAYPRAMCGLAKILHLESSVAHVGSAAVESVNDYRGLAKTSHAGPTQTGTLAKAECVGPASTHVAFSDVDRTAFAERANIGTPLTHVGTAVIRLEIDSPTAMDRVARTEHVGPPLAKLGSAVSQLGDVYPAMIGRAAWRAHVGPGLARIGSSDFGLTDVYCDPTHELAGRAHIDCALAYAGVGLEDVRLTLTERLTEMAHAGAALAPAGSVLVGPQVRMPTVESTAHIEPVLALYRSKITEIAGVKGAIVGSESSEDKGGSANAEAMCLGDTTDITSRRGLMNDECLVRVVENLPVNAHKSAIVCATESRETRGICEDEAAGPRDFIDVIHRTQCMKDPLPSTIGDKMVHKTAKIVARQVIGDALLQIQGKDGGTEYETANEGEAVTSDGDGKHCVTIDDFAHRRVSLESATLCEEEEQMYDAMFSSDGEDSGSLLVLSAHWNPWETGRHTDEPDSNPPAEFLSTPMINSTLGMLDRNTPESSSKCACEERQEEGNGSPDLTLLCVLLGLDEQGLRMEAKKHSPPLQINEQSSPDFGGINHELPGSTFYYDVAKVGEKHFRYAEALDFWLQRLSQAQTEPYCRALLLIAKASVQEVKGSPLCSSCKFPYIIQEWLAVHHVADQQERI